MGKAMGVLCILAGACGGIASWYFGKVEKIHRMEAILDFLRRAAEAVEQQTPMLHFLQSCPCRDNLLSQALKLTTQELEANTWESGESAWESAILAIGVDGNAQYGRKNYLGLSNHWNWNQNQWETFCAIGQMFGAESKDAILDHLYRQNRKWEGFLEEERRQLVQQQRVVFPVGMLSGVMLVLLLI